MNEETKTREQLIKELKALRQKVSNLEQNVDSNNTNEPAVSSSPPEREKTANEIVLNQNEEIVTHLKESRLFAQWPEKMLKQLIPLSRFSEYSEGTPIIIEGQGNDRVYFLIRGEVGVYGGGKFILDLKRKGDIFGEMSIITQKASLISVVAKTFVKVFSIDMEHIGNIAGIDADDLNNTLYRLFAMIMTDKLSMTTHESLQYEDQRIGFLSEINDHKKAIAKLKRRHEILVKAQKQFNMGNWDWDLTTNEATWSEQMFRIFGLDPQRFQNKMTGELVFKYIHPEDLKKITKLYQRARSEPNHSLHSAVEFRIIRSDGKERMLRSQGAVEYDDAGTALKIFSTLQDITENRTLVKKQKESEERLRLHTEHSPLAIIECDSNFTITRWTGAAKHIFGWDQEEAVGKPIDGLNILHKEDKGEIEEVRGRLAAGQQETIVSSIRNVTKDGKIILCKWHHSVVLDKKNKMSSVVSQVVDVTDKKDAEDVLIINEKILNKIVSSTLIGVYIYDLKKRNFVFTNPQLTALTGYNHDDLNKLMEGDVSQVFHSDDMPVLNNLMSQLIHAVDDPSFSTEYRIKHTNGEWVWLNSKDAVFDRKDDGNVSQLIGVCIDITERKRLEEKLAVAIQQAEAANAANNEFLTNMSLQLRTPLNNLIGHSQVLEFQLEKILNEQHLKSFRFIKEGGDQSLEMIGDILDLAKLETGKIDINFKPFDFAKMLENSPSLIESLISKEEISLQTNIQPGLGWLNGDEVRLKQVMVHLLSTAAKFSDESKQMGLDAKSIDDCFEINVWDEGVDIPSSYLEKIFDPYPQITENKQNKKPEIGLGLVIAKKLIEYHGGNLEVSNEEGKGYRFSIVLPGRIEVSAMETNANESPISPETTDFMKGIKLLLVENNHAHEMFLKNIIKPMGGLLESTSSGEDAIRLAKENKFDFILMDTHLPGIDSAKALKELKNNGLDKTTFIAFSDFATKDDENKYLDQGFDGHIPKPINIKRLLELIKKQIN